MSWARGVVNGREVGYGIEDTCHAEGCDEKIDRGLGYRCGGYDFDYECPHGGFVCGTHLAYTVAGPRCPRCVEWVDALEDELERFVDRLRDAGFADDAIMSSLYDVGVVPDECGCE